MVHAVVHAHDFPGAGMRVAGDLFSREFGNGDDPTAAHGSRAHENVGRQPGRGRQVFRVGPVLHVVKGHHLGSVANQRQGVARRPQHVHGAPGHRRRQLGLFPPYAPEPAGCGKTQRDEGNLSVGGQLRPKDRVVFRVGEEGQPHLGKTAGPWPPGFGADRSPFHRPLRG